MRKKSTFKGFWEQDKESVTFLWAGLSLPSLPVCLVRTSYSWKLPFGSCDLTMVGSRSSDMLGGESELLPSYFWLGDEQCLHAGLTVWSCVHCLLKLPTEANWRWPGSLCVTCSISLWSEDSGKENYFWIRLQIYWAPGDQNFPVRMRKVCPTQLILSLLVLLFAGPRMFFLNSFVALSVWGRAACILG